MAADLASPVESLERRLGVERKAIRKAWRGAQHKKTQIEAAIKDVPSSDMSFVVFGSLARGEWTVGSDLDWTLLIDGVVDAKHQEAVHEVRRILLELEESTDGKKRAPGREGTFGGIAFSHPIVHQIGGEHDTNRNVTQRILLLSESIAVGRQEAYKRVLAATVGRYVRDDRGFLQGSSEHRVPRFLLNDIVRYWRTVAVDFAYKQQTRGGQGMALRNIKLRLSRKLVFAAGLVRCFQCAHFAPENALHGQGLREGARAEDFLCASVETPPLSILDLGLNHFRVSDRVARDLFGAYDEFLALLDDEEKRRHLDELEVEKFGSDAVFEEGRGIGRRFDEALKRMFFDGPGLLPKLTRKYGVF
jgi:predicted nucleotidyltransferase